MEINGVKVHNATKPVVITISPKDVMRGNTKDPAACAAALACKRELHATDARIHVGRSYLKIDGEWVRFRTSAALRSEIVAFDRGGTFEPGEYLLQVPLKPSQGIKKTKPKGTKDNRVKIARKIYHKVTSVRERGANR